MENPIKQIVNFNQKAGLLGKGYNARLEAAFQVEEALEGFDVREIYSRLFGPIVPGQVVDAKTVARAVLSCDTTTKEISPVDALDKAGDAVVFAVGSMAKLGLNAQEITKALNIIVTSCLAKVKEPKYDIEGKLLKNEFFEGPEPALQKLLDALEV